MRTRLGKIVGAWKYLYHCWNIVVLIWVGVALAWLINVFTDWSTTKFKDWDVTDTPFEWILNHLAITLPAAGAFLAFTILVRVALVQVTKENNAIAIQPAHHAPELDLRDRARLCLYLTQWYKEFLENSLQRAEEFNVHLAEKPDAVFTPLTQAVRKPHLPEQPLEDGTSIIDVYFKAHQELCILGEPGAGKSTQLYILAQYLVQRAEIDHQAPIPIIFWLSEWTINHHSLELWMIEQLIKRYHISSPLAQHLVMERQIIPLLDGLNEMREEAQSQCINAINTYLEHPYPLVICSTNNEYATMSQTSPLHLQLAVVLKPLVETDIATVLANGGRSLAGLRNAYKHNPALRELATTPLLLNLLLLTYRGITVRDLPTKTTVLQRKVFERYVAHMINHKDKARQYSPQQIRHWLAWLAHQMRQHNQTIFAIEDLQPDWLTRKIWWSQLRWPTWLRALATWFKKTRYYQYSRNAAYALIVEQVRWDWKKAIPGIIVITILFGLCVPTLWEANGFLGLWFGISTAISYGYIFGLEKTFIPQRIPSQSYLRPGEGLRRSGRNGLFIGGLIGILYGSSTGIAAAHLLGLPMAIVIGIVWGLSCMTNSRRAGLTGYINHYMLRWRLWRAGVFPLKALTFLDAAHTLHLLRRTGGSYQFRHDLLQDFFEKGETF